MLSLGASLTNRNAAAVLRDALARLAAGATTVDCSELRQVDSSAVAVMLALHRAANGRAQSLSFAGVPPKLASLAALYGVDSLLAVEPRAAASGHRH